MPLHRTLFPALTEHLHQRQVTVITGLRRVGKSTALKHLMEQVPHDNKLYLDFERIENRILFNQSSYNEIERGLTALGIDLSKPAVIALDEVQLVPNSPSVIKSLYDTWGAKFIATGSSSFYLKNHFSESLAGRKKVFEMHPLDFQEFVRFKGGNENLLEAGRLQVFHPTFYDQWKGLYDEYLQYGGFPEVALADGPAQKTDYLRDVLNAYIELDVRLLSDFSASDVLFKMIGLLSARVGSRLDVSKLSSLLGINRNKVADYLHLLEYTFFLRIIRPFTTGLDKELSKKPKYYFTDTGLLQLAGRVGSGQVFENAIASQLYRIGELHYYQRSNGQEIDFVLNREVAIEVKETPSQLDLAELKARAATAGLSKFWLAGAEQPPSGFSEFVWGGSVW